MFDPSDDFREEVYGLVSELDFAEDQGDVEFQLDAILDRIGSEATIASEEWDTEYHDLDPDRAQDVLASVNSWASLVSYAVARAYGPSSPWPKRMRRNLAGWSAKIAKRIQWLVNILLKPLAAAAKLVGASSHAIGLNFPWGVSVQFTWP